MRGGITGGVRPPRLNPGVRCLLREGTWGKSAASSLISRRWVVTGLALSFPAAAISRSAAVVLSVLELRALDIGTRVQGTWLPQVVLVGPTAYRALVLLSTASLSSRVSGARGRLIVGRAFFMSRSVDPAVLVGPGLGAGRGVCGTGRSVSGAHDRRSLHVVRPSLQLKGWPIQQTSNYGLQATAGGPAVPARHDGRAPAAPEPER